MEKTDARILRELILDFPIHRRPYDVIARRLNLTGDEVYRRTCRLINNGIIRRIGPGFNSAALGRVTTLVGLRLRPDSIDNAAKIINAFPEVTHNYLRADEFNIWFTIIAPHRRRIDEIIKHIADRLELTADDIINAPSEKVFKLAPVLPDAVRAIETAENE